MIHRVAPRRPAPHRSASQRVASPRNATLRNAPIIPQECGMFYFPITTRWKNAC